jgi:hypothetical protein
MTSLWWFSGLVVLGLGVIGLYRGAWILADREAAMWKRRAKAAGWCPSLADRMWDKIEPQLPPVPLPPFSYPLDLVIGTPSCPVVLDRGGSLDDTAVASTLSDLVKGCGGRL